MPRHIDEVFWVKEGQSPIKQLIWPGGVTTTSDNRPIDADSMRKMGYSERASLAAPGAGLQTTYRAIPGRPGLLSEGVLNKTTGQWQFTGGYKTQESGDWKTVTNPDGSQDL